MLVSDLDESDLIARFTEVLPTGERTLVGPGDDCAQVAAPEGTFLVTCDVLVDGHHFRRDWSSPDEIGERAAAQNLADVAAMGARTSALVVSLTLPAHTDVDWLVALVAGFGHRARMAGAGVVGGDLSGGEQFTISVTAHGYTQGAPVLRSGARPGDVLALAGTLGHSGAGLELLGRGIVDPRIHDDVLLGEWAEPVAVYRAPRPPLEAGPVAATWGAHAMMDVSDGLGVDALRMARASGVVLDLDAEALAVRARELGSAARACGHPAMDWVLHSGEDHSLLACFPPHVVLPTPFHPIGTVGAVGPGGRPRVRMGDDEVTGGWSHFAPGV